jgi:hypothetical protein
VGGQKPSNQINLKVRNAFTGNHARLRLRFPRGGGRGCFLSLAARRAPASRWHPLRSPPAAKPLSSGTSGPAKSRANNQHVFVLSLVAPQTTARRCHGAGLSALQQARVLAPVVFATICIASLIARITCARSLDGRACFLQHVFARKWSPDSPGDDRLAARVLHANGPACVFLLCAFPCAELLERTDNMLALQNGEALLRKHFVSSVLIV